jgi:hypothetical protein
MPIHSRELILVGEVIADFALESLLQRVASPLDKMLRSCGANEPPVLIRLLSHYPRERIIDGCALGFLVKKTLNLRSMR